MEIFSQHLQWQPAHIRQMLGNILNQDVDAQYWTAALNNDRRKGIYGFRDPVIAVQQTILCHIEQNLLGFL
eukprot:8671359-Ditylum_brightwellii.AAC.1